MAISFGFGPEDWLKMSGASTKPLTSTYKPPSPVGTPSTIPTVGSGTTAPQTTPSPIPNTNPLGGGSTPTNVPSPFQSTDPAFNVAPPNAPSATPAPVMSMNTAAPATGVTYAPSAPQTVNYDPGPIPMGVTQETPQTVNYNPEPVATGSQQTYANPWDDPNYQEPTPPPASTYDGQGAAMTAAEQQAEKDKAIQAANGQSQATAMATADQNRPAPTPAPQPVQPPTATAAPEVAAPNMVTAAPPPNATTPVKTEPSLDDNMGMYEKIAADWANGIVDDKVFRTTANRAILQMGLNNQAETDALQMRINQDPALRGQGAGSALLSMMAANHGFSADQMFGQLAQSTQEKILDMQKYGLQQGVAINQMRRQNDYTKLQMLQDTGDFAGAAQLAAKIADFPGVSISPTGFTAARTRLNEDAKVLMAAGNYTGAAEKLSSLTGQPIDATQLQGRDPALWTQAQALEDKGDYEGAAKMYAKLGVSVSASTLMQNNTGSRARMSEDIQTLLNAGNFQGAAEKMAALTGKPVDPAQLQGRDTTQWKIAQALEDKGDFEGAAAAYAKLGLNITADDLRAQSPEQQGRWTNSLDSIKAIASTDPAAATALLDTLMKNPAAAKYLGFTAGMKASDLINSIVTGQYQKDQEMRASMQSEINLKAKSNVSFSQALVDYKAMGPLAWQGMTQSGQKMAASDLNAFNSARSSLGMSAVHKDAQGNIVDAQGNALTEEDFAESAAAADYTSRKDALKTQPWQSAFDNLMAPGSPMRDKILSLPGGEQAVKESLQMLYLGGGYKLDPASQTLVPDYTGGMPWENPNTEHLFHNWPLAQFNEDGSVNGKYDLGGETYGDKMGDTVIQKMPDDESLDNAYSRYKYNKGTLSAPEWYFATAGGTKAEDKTRIPEELVKADLTTPGAVTTPGGTSTPSNTPAPIAGTPLTTEQVQTVGDYIASIDAKIPSTVDKLALNGMVAEIGKANAANYTEDYGGLIQTMANKYPGATGSTKNSGDPNDPNDIYNNPNLYTKEEITLPSGKKGIKRTVTQKAVDFYNFTRLKDLGLTDEQAFNIMIKTASDQRMRDAYKAFTGSEYSGQ